MFESSTLEFSSIEQWWRMMGTITDQYDNIFRLFVLGTKEETLHEFMRRVQEGSFRVGIRVTPGITERRAPEVYPDMYLSGRKGELLTKTQVGDLRIGISRFNMKTPRPYSISYIIDPPLNQSETYTATFGGGIPADVYCKAEDGQLEVRLREYNSLGNIIFDEEKSLTNGETASWYKTGYTYGYWAVRVKGIDMSNTYTLIYNKIYA